MSETATNHFERIGGEPAVSLLIDRFYERVQADPVLAPFFRDSSMDRVRRMQKEFFALALDGPPAYTGMRLSHAHSGRGITVRHFSRFAGHLLETLRELPLDEREVLGVIDRLNIHADDITGGATVSS